MKEKITIKEYNELPEKEAFEFKPRFKTKEVEVEDLCECCGQSLGTTTIDKNYGEPIGYIEKDMWDHAHDMWRGQAREEMARILKASHLMKDNKDQS